MRRFATIITISLFFIAGLSAQSMTFTASSGGGFDVSTGTDLNETIMVGSTSYDVFATSDGSKYLICNSPKTGNDYAVWIGTPTKETFEGETVRQAKSGGYFILIKSKNTNNPYCKRLKTEQ
mgnify:CR=1 FL=1|tara:strand:+ start:2265 stop:2630 length:366 start_codon:yes stop_codon:yes gene_type:complete